MLGRPEPARLGSSEEVYGAVEDRSRQRSISEVLSVRAGRIACGPVNTAADIAADPHAAARDMILQVDRVGRTIGIAGIPIKLTGTPASHYVHAPLLGEHADEILEEVGRRRAGLVTGPPPPPSTGSAGERP
jgi:crotonobetainyl-CoA:carnitine CoA-transferase CaiB-like acyl-CoA transferase